MPASTEKPDELAQKPTRGRGRPRGAAPIVTREQVIEAAVRAVRALGPAVTMDDIAAEAGITKPIIYRTVGDKEAVGVAIADYLSFTVEDRTLELLESEDHPRERLRVSVHGFFKFLTEERSLFLFVEHGWAAPGGAQFELMVERAAAKMIDTYSGAAQRRRFPPTAARTWAYASVGALHTVAVMWIRDPYCELDEVVEHMTTYLDRPL